MTGIAGPLAWVLAMAASLPGTPAGASETAPWEGIWAAEPEWCAHAAEIGSRTPAPVRLTADIFEGYENSCDVSDARRIGQTRAWLIGLACQSEGSLYDDRMLVIMEGQDVMWQQYQGLEPIRFQRCRAR